MIEDKYLDPSQNPMIPMADVPFAGEIEDPYLDPSKNPMIVSGEKSNPFDPELLTERLSAAFPGENEVKIGIRTFVKMADGKFIEGEGLGRPLSELPLADLMMIGDFLRDREKG